MPLLPSANNYTDKDFDGIRERMFDLIRSVFPNWTNEAVTNFGNLLAESPCFVLDVLTFYQDQQAREGRFKTVQLRKNMIALAKLLNYDLAGAGAATADVVLTVTNADALVGPVVPATSSPIIVGTTAVTDPVKGELQSLPSFDIDSGEVEKTVGWEHSITQTPLVVPSSGRADQRILLPFGPFLDNSESVSTPTQPTWTKVDTFYYSGPTDQHYRVQVDQNNLGTIIFGDGRQGVIPVGNITLPWKTGGGTDGNVEAGSLKKIEGDFIDSEGTRAYLEATNPVDAEGGLPREEVAAARINAPESTRVLNRTVAREDYEINAKRVVGVGRALMLTSNEYSGIGENRGQLFIIPSTGGYPSQALLDQVFVMCTSTYPNTITFQLQVLPVAYLNIDVRAVIWLQENTVPSTVKQSIITNLEDYFEPMLANGQPNPNVDFGFNYKDADGNPAGEIAFSDIFNVVRDTSGVRKVGAGATEFQLNGVRDDVSLPLHQFPALGSVTVINGQTGTAI